MKSKSNSDLKKAFLSLGISIDDIVTKTIQPNYEYLSTKVRSANRQSNRYGIVTCKLTLTVVQRVYEDNIKKYGVLTCYLCKQPIAFGKDSIDHIIPISRGGTHDYDNLNVAHRSCNHKKSARTPEEYKRRIPRGLQRL